MSRKSKVRARERAEKTPAQGQGGLTPQARYDAAGYGRRLRSWYAPPSGPNRAIDGQETLRNRARDATRNEWAANKSEDVWGANLIGTGIVPRPKTKDPALKEKLRELWQEEFVPNSDADGVLDFYGQQTLAAVSVITSGEVFVRLRWRRPQDGLTIPFQLQMLESDMCPRIDVPLLDNGNSIRSGVELDQLGRRVAAWFYRTHPGDGYVNGGVSLTDLSRVPVEELIHVFRPRRPGQLRGVTEFSSVLLKLRDWADMDDAVLLRQKLANLFTGFLEEAASQGNNLDPITGGKPEMDPSGLPMASLEPGLMQRLGANEKVTFSNPPGADTNYDEYMKRQGMMFSAGVKAPYELVTGDIENISDRTLRVIIQEFRRLCQQWQYQIFIPQMCQKVRNWFAQAAVLAGELTPEEGKEARRVLWSPQAWPYIHPTQDLQAKKIAIDAGITARSKVIQEDGEDPDDIDAMRAEDLAREKKLNIVKDPATMPDNGSGG